jgi:drug/metabolite transporter (DMT)-like permease
MPGRPGVTPDAATGHAWLRAMPWIFVLIWSTGFVVARFGMPHAPPMKFLAVRYALSLACFAVWVLWSRPAWPSGSRQRLHLAVTGVLMHAGYLGGVWSAVKAGLGAGAVALIVGLQPVLTALWVSRGADSSERVTRLQWVGLALGVTGLVLVVSPKLGQGEVTAWTVMLAVFSLLCITSGTLYQKRHVMPCDVRTASCVQLLAALAVTAPLAALESGEIDWQPALVGAMAWSVAVLTLGGASLLYLLIQRGAATSVTALLYLVPPCTAAMAWALFREPLPPVTLLGFAITALGVALVVRRAAAPVA